MNYDAESVFMNNYPLVCVIANFQEVIYVDDNSRALHPLKNAG